MQAWNLCLHAMLKLHVSTASGISTGWGINRWWTALLRRSWGVQVDQGWTWPSNVHLQPRKTTVSWAASRAAWTAQWGKGCCPSALLKPHLHCSGVLSTKRTRISESKGGQPRLLERWITSPKKKCWEKWGCSVWKRKGSVDTLRDLPVLIRGVRKSRKKTFYKVT